MDGFVDAHSALSHDVRPGIQPLESEASAQININLIFTLDLSSGGPTPLEIPPPTLIQPMIQSFMVQLTAKLNYKQE